MIEIVIELSNSNCCESCKHLDNCQHFDRGNVNAVVHIRSCILCTGQTLVLIIILTIILTIILIIILTIILILILTIILISQP